MSHLSLDQLVKEVAWVVGRRRGKCARRGVARVLMVGEVVGVKSLSSRALDGVDVIGLVLLFDFVVVD